MGRLRGGLLLVGAFPAPGQKRVDPLGRMILQARQDIGEPGPRVDVVELCGLDQSVDGGGTTAAIIRAGERPVVAVNGDATA